jgi:hypothetical protein
MTDRSHLVNPGLKLPNIALPRIDGSGSVPIRPPGRRSPVLVYMDAAECARCRSYLARLGADRASLEEWDGRVLAVIATAPENAPSPADHGFPLLLDTDKGLRDALAIEPPAVLIGDQWGQVHFGEPAGESHDFPAVEEVVQWLRYLAIQCPECQGEAL